MFGHHPNVNINTVKDSKKRKEKQTKLLDKSQSCKLSSSRTILHKICIISFMIWCIVPVDYETTHTEEHTIPGQENKIL